MSDQVSRYEDLERTDVLPQLSLEPADSGKTLALGQALQSGLSDDVDDHIESTTEQLAPLLTTRAVVGANTKISTLPSKPLPVALELGGIRGKITDLESKLLEAQDSKVDLGRQCHQLEQRSRASEQRAVKAEANYVVQASELARASQRAIEAEQRINEQRARLEAHIADIERQLVDARLRADKRSINLEQQLNGEADRAAQHERIASDLRLELERVRAELNVAHTTVQGLEERVAKQTRAASDISRLYAQQTVQAQTFVAAMEESKLNIARIQAENEQGNKQIESLQNQLREAGEEMVRLRAELKSQQQKTAELQTSIAQNDILLAESEQRGATQAIAIRELQEGKRTVENKYAGVQLELSAVRSDLAAKQAQTGRLDAEIQQQEDRIRHLETDISVAEATIRERDGIVAREQTRTRETLEQYTSANERLTSMRARLDSQQLAFDTAQNQLQARIAELAESSLTIATLQQEQANRNAEKEVEQKTISALQATAQRLEAERDELELENRNAQSDLSQARIRHDEIAQAMIVARESISVREQRNATLEQELRSVAVRLDETSAHLERASTVGDTLTAELHERDAKIAMLEQKLSEHMSALSAIGQDIERVNAAHPSDAYASLGYVLESIDNPGVTHRITRATTTVGRSNSNDIPIESTSISRYHARLLIKPEGVWLVDLQSTNGCGVNGRRASRQILCDGDSVLIGHRRFRFTAGAADKQPQVGESRVSDVVVPGALLHTSPNSGSQLQRH